MRMKCVCKTCCQPISQSDLVIRAKNYGYMHDKCVFCGRCRHRLETGDRYMLTTDNMLVCHKCIVATQPPGTSGPPPVSQQIPPPMHGNTMMPMHHPANGSNGHSHMHHQGPPHNMPMNAYQMGMGPGNPPGNMMMPQNGYGMNGAVNGTGMNHHPSMSGGPNASSGMPPSQQAPPPPPPPTTGARRGRKRNNA